MRLLEFLLRQEVLEQMAVMIQVRRQEVMEQVMAAMEENMKLQAVQEQVDSLE